MGELTAKEELHSTIILIVLAFAALAFMAYPIIRWGWA